MFLCVFFLNALFFANSSLLNTKKRKENQGYGEITVNLNVKTFPFTQHQVQG